MPVPSSSERLRRLLVLVPWVMAREGTTVREVCDRFSITREELAEDLQLLFMCGLPPFGPGDLIVALMDGEEVVIQMADYLAKPPRLTREEALALLVMGRAVIRLPGFEESGVLEGALAKLSAAIAPGEADRTRDIAARIEVELAGAGSETLAGLRAAILERAQLHLTYLSAGRDEMTERDVDPWLIFAANGNWYLVGHDHASDEERNFRVDRIEKWVRAGDACHAAPPLDLARYADGPLFTPSHRDLEVTIDLSPAAAWIMELTPYERATPAEHGWTRVQLRTPHLAWLVRLLLSAGTAVRAVEPPELIEQMRVTAERALARYA